MTYPRDITADIEAVDASGDGIGRAGAVHVAVPFTIPGERIRARIAAPSRGRARGTLIEILRASPHRVTPKCRHFGPAPGGGACGGCSWQHIAYPEQLRLKTRIVDRLVRAVIRDAPATLPTLAATPLDHPWEYRNKVHFVFSAARERGRAASAAPLQMGHYVRGSRRVIPVVECPVHDARGNRFAFAARDVYAAALDSRGPASTLRSLAVRVGVRSGELAATLVVSSDRDRRVRMATRALLEAMPPTSMHLNVHPRDDGFIFGSHTRRLHGPARMREQVGAATFLVSPTAFFQTNVDAAEILVRLVLDAVPPSSRVTDLYAGCGLFAIPLALAGHDVIAVEENREAVADGEAALKLNLDARDRCRFIARRVEDALVSLRRADVVVLDPPREGCSARVLAEVITRVQPTTLIYVSCNPEALARELDTVCRTGYQICTLQPVDMFPHSAHIETIAVLRAL